MNGELFPTLPVVELVIEGDPIVPPTGLIYSTSPKTWVAADQVSYVVKGPDLNIVVPEAIAYQLAKSLGISVPDFALGRINGAPPLLFASKKLPVHTRDVEPWIRNKRFSPANTILETIVFDIWIANKDRNIGNFIGMPPLEGTPGEIQLVAIDFEKAIALQGPYPIMSAANTKPEDLWPRGILATLIKGATVPFDMVQKLRTISDNHVMSAVHSVRNIIGDSFGWSDSIVEGLCRRRDNIHKLVTGVWR